MRGLLEHKAVDESVDLLLVEDDAADATLIRYALRTIPQIRSIGVAQSLAEATSMLGAGTQFDIILTDLHLGDSRGIQTVRSLLEISGAIPVVVLTASETMAEVGLEAVRAGAQDFLAKTEATPAMLMRVVGYAIERSRLLEQLIGQATTDPLTGLLNRRDFYSRFTTLQAIARRQGLSIAVILIDLNGFKATNDCLGHAAGDSLLVQVADRIRGTIRASDVAARWGGDEYLVAGHVAGSEAAEQLGARLSRAISAEPCDLGRDSGPVTVKASIGIAFSTATADITTLIATADHAMYAAKTGSAEPYRLVAV